MFWKTVQSHSSPSKSRSGAKFLPRKLSIQKTEMPLHFIFYARLQPRSTLASTCLRLDEAQRHAVRLADGSEARAIRIAAAVGRRQRRHHIRRGLRIAVIVVDLAARGQLESRCLRVLDDIRFSQIAGVDHLLNRRTRYCTMLFHAEHATGFQHRIKRAQVGSDLTVFYPFVNITEGHPRTALQPRRQAAELP